MLTLPQMLSFAVIALMMAAFVWGRLRYDLVAALALLAALAVGVVPLDEASSRLQRRHRHHRRQRAAGQRRRRALAASWNAPSSATRRTSPRSAPSLRCWSSSSRVLSAFVKNIGALAIMIPIAFQFARRSEHLALDLPDADGVRLAARRADDPDRHLAQHRRVARARGDHRRRPSPCSTSRRSALALAAAGMRLPILFYWILPQRARAGRRAPRGARHQELRRRGEGRRGLRRSSARRSPTFSRSPAATR